MHASMRRARSCSSSSSSSSSAATTATGRAAAAAPRLLPLSSLAAAGSGRRCQQAPTAAAAASAPSPLLASCRRHPSSSTLARAAAASPAEPGAGPNATTTTSSTPTPDNNQNTNPSSSPSPLNPNAVAAAPAPQIVSPRREASEAAADYAAVYDRLIALFEGRPREDWKKLVVFSAQWPQHRAGVFDRLKSRADAEPDVERRVALRRTYRTLQGVDGEVSRYNSALQRFLDAEEHEWEAVVAQNRGDLQRAFFEHLQCLIVAAARDEEVEKEQQQEGGGGSGQGGGGGGSKAVQAAAEAVKAAAERAKKQQEAEATAAIEGGRGSSKGFGNLGSSKKSSSSGPAAAAAAASTAATATTATTTPTTNTTTTTTDPSTKKERLIAVNARLLALVANFDSVAADTPALEKAAEAYRSVLATAKSAEDVDAAMEALARQGRVDPAFLQISARAYGAARDTEMTLDEAKWVSYRMYVKARDHFDRQQPQEKRILEYLVTLRDRAERSRLLDQAVTPGPVRGTDTHDYLYSTPTRLYKVLDGTLQAWEKVQQGAQKRMGVSERASTPRRVVAMRELRDEIRRRYL